MKFDFRVSNQIFKPTFGKIELGTVSVRKNDGGMEDVKLVEYESDDVADIKQLKGVQNSWNVKARFINNIMTAFLEDNCDNIYGLENSDGDTLVLADVCNMQYYGTRKEYCGSPCINIDLIQVNPIEKYLPTDESKKRYKGLGEMDADQLWETTMNPENRILIQLTMEDAIEAEKAFNDLMGEDPDLRRKFIEENATLVTDLDI